MQLQLWTWKDRLAQRHAKAGPGPTRQEFAAFERRLMLELARRSVSNVALGGGEITLCDIASGKLCEHRACFVTLFKGAALRGCVGNLLPQAPLYQAVLQNARAAASRDQRFEPVTSAELQELSIEISVLTELQPVRFTSPEELLDHLQPHQHGVLLQVQEKLATFLPQAWQQIPEKSAFMNRLAQKAGCAPDIWRSNRASISIYEVEAFEEERQTLQSN